LGLWVKPEPAEGPLLSWGPVSMVLQAGRVQARVAATSLVGGELPVGAWAHVALAVTPARATLYVNGVQAAQADLAGGVPAIDAALRVGGGLRAVIDELQVASVARSADWISFARASQGADAKLIASVTQSVDAEDSSGNGGYIAVLVNNLTIDAKFVIAILGAMFAVATWVMVAKALLISRVERGNRDFLKRFREGTQDLMKKDLGKLEGARTLPRSSLFRLYSAGIVELRKRNVESSNTPLSGASIDAIKAAVDADMVRETHRLNAQMVLLTIAISGGPFLGLLGTVVGVMITFAAIAAAGDVNVNAIAPGIAAALLATVAGLAVAIPSLFGYNYLASRIKNISSEMQIFVDEFATRVAERYGAR
ncbi:MAG TPA: MotA/TolQ/ExbB proton channel family protein, partial [Burkholderiaceae bacterium]|nr:MotA/TolQ/ExbB proton channel family protein [Burkholderiaceae bacterium]